MYDIENYYQRAIALLASQFQIALPDSSMTNFQKLIFSLMTQAQVINTQELLLYNNRALNTAQGVQLDGLGQILGIARIPGQSDSSYQLALQFQIFVNQSSGTPEELIYMLEFLSKATTVWYNEDYPGSFQLATNGLTFPKYTANVSGPFQYVQAIQDSSPAGVEFIGITATYNRNPFTFSSDPINEALYVSPDPLNPSTLDPFFVDPGSGAVQLDVQRGITVNPNFGGGFSEATGIGLGRNNTGAGQFAEIIVIGGDIPPIP